MIDKKDIDAYMSIKAPESLKAGLLEEQAKNNRRISSKVRMCYALAAMLLVIVAVFAFLPTGKVQLYYGDMPLDKDIILLKANNGNARISTLSNVEKLDIPLTVKTNTKTDIKASAGEFILNAEAVGQSVSVDCDTDIIWSLDIADSAEAYTLSIGKQTYCISKNDNAEWVLSKK